MQKTPKNLLALKKPTRNIRYRGHYHRFRLLRAGLIIEIGRDETFNEWKAFYYNKTEDNGVPIYRKTRRELFIALRGRIMEKIDPRYKEVKDRLKRPSSRQFRR